MTQGLVARLAALDSCAISDALDSLRLPPAVTGLAPLGAATRIAGPVLTVKLGREKPAGGAPRHLGSAAIDAAKTGDVIVVEHSSGIECAGWGGVLSVGAQLKGVAGVVIDGPARDIDDAKALGFPVFGRRAIARTARGRAYEQSFNGVVAIGGTRVEPGDYVLADSSGVVFVPRAQLEEVVRRAERIGHKERLMVEALRRGEPAAVVLGRDYENLLDELE